MKKLFLLLFSILISFNSYGEWKFPENSEWTKLGYDDDASYYLDFNTIGGGDRYVYYWVLFDNETDTNGIKSSKINFQGDCKSFRVKALSFIFYKQPKGNGEGVISAPTSTNRDWIYAPPESAMGSILGTACDYVN
jgi:hypothetical protein